MLPVHHQHRDVAAWQLRDARTPRPRSRRRLVPGARRTLPHPRPWSSVGWAGIVGVGRRAQWPGGDAQLDAGLWGTSSLAAPRTANLSGPERSYRPGNDDTERFWRP